MPEIAEVETVRNVLKKSILNKKIKTIDIYYEPIIASDINEFKTSLIGESFQDIKRWGKYLLFLTEHYTLISHLRMEGKYFIKASTEPKDKHEHVKFTFIDNSTLRYNDVRKFGRMELTKKGEENNNPSLSKLGYEPLSKELTKEYLYQKLSNKKVPLKTLLLDQTIISGLGNIYADEVLFAASLNPYKEGIDVNLADCERIIESANKIIPEAIKYGGTTIRSYTSSLGVTGSYQDYLMVHKRENLPCKKCQTKIIRVKIGGRSTYYCPNCQKK